MAEVVYLMCAATSLACAVLLFRNYRTSRVRLTLYTCLCFVGMAINNVLLFIDLVMFPATVDLASWRVLAGLVAITILLYGMISSVSREGTS